MQQFGVLDIAILNAGIGEKGMFAPDCAVVGMSSIVKSFVAPNCRAASRVTCAAHAY